MRSSAITGIAAILMLAFLAGCATMGREFNRDVVMSSIVKGKSTKADIVELCGEPLTKKYDSNDKAYGENGMDMWHYAYVTKNVTGRGVVTNVIGVGTEWKSETTILDVYFNGNVVADVKLETTSFTQMHQQ